MPSAALYVVATPIGNLEDITWRALRVLREADIILCEDTRQTKVLLSHYAIERPLLSYHQHSSARVERTIIELLVQGKSLALVTDAGTPGISDPGNQLVAAMVLRHPEIPIVPIPGPSALTAALSISGLATDKFLFLGFPPHKNKRQLFFKQISACHYTVAFYESGHRIKKCLGELVGVLGPRQKIVVCRELTKKFETIYRGTIRDVPEKMTDERGEFVVIIEKF